MGFVFLVFGTLSAQVKTDRCGTITLLKAALAKDPTLAARMANNEALLKQAISNKKVMPTGTTTADTLLIPVVFHIVLSDPTVVSDANIQAQMDTLNKDYAGLNGDSSKIPGWFKPLFGHSTIRFALAKRTPANKPTTGIIRKVSTGESFTTDDRVKSSSTGGDDPWNTSEYLNIWLCPLSGGLLGYSQIPGMSILPGVVVEYRSLPGVTEEYPYNIYNEGKTLTHEVGHFFNLYHIWGDDDGACTGTDYVDDTPNQGNSTSGTYTGVHFDNCSVDSPGIMYQNYMDYTDDDGMEMFTLDQVTRMEAAAMTFRASLLTSLGAKSLATQDYDASVSTINQPGNRLCGSSVMPVVTITNYGLKPLTSLMITASVDGGQAMVANWTGNVATLDSFQLKLGPLTAALTEGAHQLVIYTSKPDGQTDEALANDTLTQQIIYTTPVSAPFAEGFEEAEFPATGWDILNPDGDITWTRTTLAASSGTHSARILNYSNINVDTKDYLRLPQVTIGHVDSAWMTFKVAYGMGTVSAAQFGYDTLEVMASTDCGATYTSLYKKWGTYLSTTTASVSGSYVPEAPDWRKDSVDLSRYIGQGPVMLAFVSTNEHINNLYLDDVNIYTDTVSASVRDKGIVITPNPTTGPLTISFYSAVTDLKGIGVYDIAGKQVAKVAGSTTPNTRYTIDLSSLAPGIYVVKVVTASKTVVKEIVKIK